MGITTHFFTVAEARRTSHPVFPEISKHWFTVPANKFPQGITYAANARDPVGLNRRVYRDVKESLEGSTYTPGTFDLMNKGITILAEDVRLVDKNENVYEVDVDDDAGIVDGAHTAAIIASCIEDGTVGEEQFVEVYIRTGIHGRIITDIARGLNTALKVADKSIYNIDGVFDWLKELVSDEPYGDMFAWKESDKASYDVRDLIGILEIFNVIDWPNDASAHPISSYEKWSTVLNGFAADFEEHRDDIKASKYYRLRPIMKEALVLYDMVRREFRSVHNEQGGSAGKMNIVEDASKRQKTFTFDFGGFEPSPYRLTKGAAYPILNSFRNYVELDRNGNAKWLNGFNFVLREFNSVFSELVAETYNATKNIGRMPDQLGKSRPHWDNLHMKVQLRLLRAQVKRQRDENAKIRK